MYGTIAASSHVFNICDGCEEMQHNSVSFHMQSKMGMATCVSWCAFHLVLSSLVVHATGTTALASWLSDHPSITSIDLRDNPISDEGGVALLQMLRNNPRINDLKLQGTHLMAAAKSNKYVATYYIVWLLFTEHKLVLWWQLVMTDQSMLCKTNLCCGPYMMQRKSDYHRSHYHNK